MKQPIRMEDIFTTKNIGPALGFGVLSILLLFLMLPNLKPGREEVRQEWAYMNAGRIAFKS